jgi:P27 family predicted phage terminase small subunit
MNPKELLNEAGFAEWQRIHAIMDVHALDESLLLVYCNAYGEFQHLSKLANEGSPSYTSANGNEILHPVITAKGKAADMMLRAAKELGFSPASRKRIGNFEEPELDEFTQFLNRGKL